MVVLGGGSPRSMLVYGIVTIAILAFSYFVIIRRGIALAVGAAGEIISVAHAFQPSGRFSAANSL